MDGRRAVDVAVVGAGIVGAAVARALAREGLSVAVLDRGGAVGGTTASGEGNVLVSDKGPGAELALALRSVALWPGAVAELRDELGPAVPGVEYERKGGLVVATGEPGAVALLGFAAEQRTAGVDARPVTPAEALALEPALTRAAVAAVHYPQDAQVQPVAAAEALLASARRHGARVEVGAEVLGPVLVGDRLVGVRTSAGTLLAGQVVLAAGPWSADVARRLGTHVPVEPRRGVVLVTARMPHRILHKVYDADYVGAVESGAADLRTSSVVESTRAGTVLIGSSRERCGFDARLRVDVLRELAAKALVLFPFLAGTSVMRAYGGFRPATPDGLPVIGPDVRLRGLWHATGHEGAGIGLSLATAELVRDLLLGRPPAVDADPFRLDRPALGVRAAARVQA